jgi:1,4-alpha-glucan branching enzyme
MVSKPTYLGGLGFSLKWNMGWMHDTLGYMAKDPLFRRFHHNQMTFGMLYAFHENFILPISHDEVVHGKGSLLNKMTGDEWQKFAGLRAYLAFMWGYSGKKLLFMGCDFGQWQEWNHDTGLEWQALNAPHHRGVQRLVRDLNLVYRHEPALHQVDFEWSGFRWIDANDSDNSVLSFIRLAENPENFIVIVCNFTPVVREQYRIGVPKSGAYRELINSDLNIYGGSGIGNGQNVVSVPEPCHSFEHTLTLTLPPLATLFLQPCS